LLDAAHAARRKYKKDLDLIKPDLTAYNRQKEVALGYAPGTLTTFNPTAGSSSMEVRESLLAINIRLTLTGVQVVPTSHEQQLAAENLYRDANTLMYGDSKPSEDAIDRVVEKINKECVLCPSGYPEGI
jgi:pre-mRNA-splicing factor SYF2